MPIIAPSILNANFLRLEEEIKMLNRSEADWIHLDIMDGVFVPNLTFGFPIIKQIKSCSEKPLDVHLMITEPDRYIEEFKMSGADRLTVQHETCKHLDRTIEVIRQLGMQPAVALNPHTPVSLLKNILPKLSMVLIMTVNPGFGGQEFIGYSFQKIIELREMIDRSGVKVLIEVDGGINKDNIKSLTNVGVDVFVVGKTIFGADNPSQMIKDLKELKNLEG